MEKKNEKEYTLVSNFCSLLLLHLPLSVEYRENKKQSINSYVHRLFRTL